MGYKRGKKTREQERYLMKSKQAGPSVFLHPIFENLRSMLVKAGQPVTPCDRSPHRFLEPTFDLFRSVTSDDVRSEPSPLRHTQIVKNEEKQGKASGVPAASRDG